MASFEIESAVLKANLISANKFVSSKSDRRDSTKCIKFIAGIDEEGDFLELRATNLDVEFTQKIRSAIMVHAYGEFIVKGATILDYVKAVEDESIIITVNNGSVVICEENASLEVAAGPIDDFPEFTSIQNQNSIIIDSHTLYSCLQKAFFATADQGHGRHGSIDAVCLEFNDNMIIISGTDTQRASVVRLEADCTANSQYLVSSKSCEALKSIVEGNVELCLSDRAISITSSNSTILMKRINGDYPDVSSLIPENGYSHEFSINTKTLSKALNKVRLAIASQSPIVISISEGVLVLQGYDNGSENKRVETTLPIEYRGDSTQFSVNCDHMISLLKVLDPESDIELNFEYDGSTLLFKQGNLVHLLRRMEV